jgi:hypothetical protein
MEIPASTHVMPVIQAAVWSASETERDEQLPSSRSPPGKPTEWKYSWVKTVVWQVAEASVHILFR